MKFGLPQKILDVLSLYRSVLLPRQFNRASWKKGEKGGNLLTDLIIPRRY